MSNYLKLFKTTSEYGQYIEQDSPLLPNVSYTEDALKVYYNPIPHDYSKDYFTIVVTEGGNISFDTGYTQGISISKDNGETWNEVEIDGIDVSEGDTILVKCMLSTAYNQDGYNFITTSSENFKAKIQGNIMSLLVSDDFMDAIVLENNYLSSLFKNSEWLIDAQNLVLPATTLVTDCYESMFVNCSNLLYSPKILPATTLAEGCYANMFNGCSSLVTAPVLPTTTLVKECYFAMFDGCTSLNYVKAMFTTDISQNVTYTNGWLNNVSATGTFVGNAEASWLDDFIIRTNSTVPEGWTIEKE